MHLISVCHPTKSPQVGPWTPGAAPIRCCHHHLIPSVQSLFQNCKAAFQYFWVVYEYNSYAPLPPNLFD